MQKIDLDALSIEELAKLRDNAGVKLTERVNARRKELEAELARLSIYGKGRQGARPSAPKLVKENVREALKEPAKDSQGQELRERRLEPSRTRDMRSAINSRGPCGSRLACGTHRPSPRRAIARHSPQVRESFNDCARS